MTLYPNHRAFYYRARKKDGQGDRFLTFVEELKGGLTRSSYREWDRASRIRIGPEPTHENGGVRDGCYQRVFATELQDALPEDVPLFDDSDDINRTALPIGPDVTLPADLLQRCERELQRSMEEEPHSSRSA